MQQRSFGRLFRDGARLCGRDYGAGLLYGFLYIALPLYLVMVVAFSALHPLFAPFLQALRDNVTQNGIQAIRGLGLLRSAYAWLESGGLQGGNLPKSSLYLLVGLACGVGPLLLLSRFFLKPLTAFRCAGLSNAGWFGRRLSLGEAFAYTEGRRARVTGLALVRLAAEIVLMVVLGGLSTVGYILLATASVIPGVGLALRLIIGGLQTLAGSALTALCTCLWLYMLLVLINEGQGGFRALGRALQLLFKRGWAPFLGIWLILLIEGAVASVAGSLDLACLLWLELPPLFSATAGIWTLPWLCAYATLCYYDTRVIKEGMTLPEA